MTPMPNHRTNERRINWRAIGSATGIGAVVTVVIALALGLAGYAAAASYKSVSDLAARDGVPLAWLTPAGIDGGLLAIIVFDIALTITGKPIRWLRMTGRLFAVGVLAANFAAGWPDPVGIALRLAAPALFIVIVEAARTVLLHRHDDPEEDRIPRLRWLLAFRATLALWRRMKLWGEKSYSRAVAMELDRIAAIEKLSVKYAPYGWELNAPADLVWMLRDGVRMPEALGRVAELLAADAVADETLAALDAGREAREALGRDLAATRDELARMTAKAEALTRKLAAGGSGRSGNGNRKGAGNGSGRSGNAGRRTEEIEEAPADLDSELKVLWYLDRGLNPSQAGKRAGLTDRRGRQIAGLREPAPKGIDQEPS
jgi:Protein of unknown function (DUF2637)